MSLAILVQNGKKVWLFEMKKAVILLLQDPRDKDLSMQSVTREQMSCSLVRGICFVSCHWFHHISLSNRPHYLCLPPLYFPTRVENIVSTQIMKYLVSSLKLKNRPNMWTYTYMKNNVITNAETFHLRMSESTCCKSCL